MGRLLETEIVINSPPAKVWNILTRFEDYSKWNPFIVSAEGDLTVGSQLCVRISPPGGKPMTFKPQLLTLKPHEELKWVGRVWFSGFFEGEHRFELEKLQGNRTRLKHSETFKGILTAMIWKDLNTKTRRGFELMNEALKQRAEAH